MFLVSAVDQILDSSAVAVILFCGNLHQLSWEIRNLEFFFFPSCFSGVQEWKFACDGDSLALHIVNFHIICGIVDVGMLGVVAVDC